MWGRMSDDARQFVAVLVVLAIAIVLGLLVKSFVEGQTRSVTGGGLRAAIPADWVYQPGGGDVAFVANDPRIPGHRYLVTQIDAAPGGLRETVDRYAGAKSQLHTAYQSLGSEQVDIGRRTGEAVTYAFVLDRQGRVPQAIQARDVFIEEDDQVLVISMEGPADRFDDSLAAFETFVASVEECPMTDHPVPTPAALGRGARLRAHALAGRQRARAHRRAVAGAIGRSDPGRPADQPHRLRPARGRGGHP